MRGSPPCKLLTAFATRAAAIVCICVGWCIVGAHVGDATALQMMLESLHSHSSRPSPHPHHRSPMEQQQWVWWCSVGAHVRDAAAYVCWAFARAYTAADLAHSISVLAPALLVTACYDREVLLEHTTAIFALSSYHQSHAPALRPQPCSRFCRCGLQHHRLNTAGHFLL